MSIDWALLKKPLVFIVAVVVLAGAGLGFLWLRYEDTHSRFVGAEKERQEAYARYQRAESDLALFKQYKESFLEYKRKGVIGQENRLSWAEVLHKQDLALNLPLFNVEISPRHALYKVDAPQTIKWFQSSQSIRASLLHEGDLLQIFQSLTDHAEGLFRVSSCKLKRAPEIQLTPQAENINADCILQWYSLQIVEVEGQGYVD